MTSDPTSPAEDAPRGPARVDLVALAAETRAAGAECAGYLDGSRVARALAEVFALIRARDDTRVRRAVDGLVPATGLSREMVDWGLEATLASATEDALRAMVPPAPLGDARAVRARAARGSLTTVFLAGNVFTAAARALAAPLLAGSAVVAKASSQEAIFPELIASLLRERDPALGACLQVVSFPGGSTELEDALLTHSDAVAVYGSDATISVLRGRMPPATRLVAHGHGLGAAIVPAAALGSTLSARETAEAVALDVAAYDQRGCLSPHAILVETNGAVDPESFAELLSSHGLGPLRARLPRGALPVDVGAAQVQWRAVAAMRGVLLEHDGYAVSYEGGGPVRVSPGWRNIAVLSCDSTAQALSRLEPFGAHLKALGVAAPLEARQRLAAALPPGLFPRISGVGAMQRPPFASLYDGAAPWESLARWAEVD